MKLFVKMKEYAPLPLRMIFVYYLFTALKSQVYAPSTINSFAENLEGLNWPMPLVLAWIGSYTVLIGYVLIIVGFKIRYAAIPIIIYFAVASFGFHFAQGHSVKDAMPALILMALGIFFLFNGAGKPSIDEGI